MQSISALYLCAAVLSFTLQQSTGKVVVLTEANFDRLTADEGESWLVNIYAPWCSHCKQLAPIWERVGRKLEGQGVKVGKIDGTQNSVLVQRFLVEGFPTIVHLKDGQTRRYDGVGEEKQLMEFALKGWQQVDALPFYMAPNSKFGRVVGQILGVPSQVSRLWQYMHTTLHMPVLLIVLVFLSCPILLGLGFLVLLDYWHTASLQAQGPHQHQQ